MLNFWRVILDDDFIALADFVSEHSQSLAAEAIKVSQPAISQMLENKRKVFVRKVGQDYCAYELKLIGRPIPEAANDELYISCGK